MITLGLARLIVHSGAKTRPTRASMRLPAEAGLGLLVASRTLLPTGGNPSQPAAATVPVAEPRAKENSARRQKLVKALDYLVAINVIYLSVRQRIHPCLLNRLLQAAIKKFAETTAPFIRNPRTRTRPQPWQGKGRSRRSLSWLRTSKKTPSTAVLIHTCKTGFHN